MPEQTPMTGLERRYEVHKIDDPDGKHDDCHYFVLDPQHDPIAREALRRYAMLARHAGQGDLALDLHDWLDSLTQEDAHA